MKIYFLERMRLRDLAQIKDSVPTRGDIVVYLRDAQALSLERAYFLDKGIECFNGEYCLSHDEAKRMDVFFYQYITEWIRLSIAQSANPDTAIIAKSIATSFPKGNKLTIVLRRAEILRKLLAEHNNCDAIITDIKDGLTYFENLLGENESVPQRTAINEVAARQGIVVFDIRPAAPLPPSHRTSSNWKFRMLFRYFLGGWRPRYLVNRLYWRFKPKKRNRVCIFNSHGLTGIAESISQKGIYDIFTDRSSHGGPISIRHDHLFPLPSIGLISAAIGFRGSARTVARALKTSGMTTYNEFDYESIFSKAVAKTIHFRLPYVVTKLSQSKALIKNYKIDAVVINGETPPALGAANACKKAIYVDHGLNVFEGGPPCNFGCQENFVYVVCGDDHLANYGRRMEANKKPRTVVLSSPGLPVMNPIKGKRQENKKSKILLGNFSPNLDTTTAKYFKNDQYMIDLFSAVKILSCEGLSFTYRRHHGEAVSYPEFFAKELGIGTVLTIDNRGTFSDALFEHGAFVANATSCIYQSLYAGWPTVFFEPQFNADDFLGLPAAIDFVPPVAKNVEQLVKLIRATQDRESWISRFPAAFNSEHAERFIGPHPDQANDRIGDFIVSEIV